MQPTDESNAAPPATPPTETPENLSAVLIKLAEEEHDQPWRYLLNESGTTAFVALGHSSIDPAHEDSINSEAAYYPVADAPAGSTKAGVVLIGVMNHGTPPGVMPTVDEGVIEDDAPADLSYVGFTHVDKRFIVHKVSR